MSQLITYEHTLTLKFMSSLPEDEYESNFYLNVANSAKPGNLVGKCLECGNWYKAQRRYKRFCSDKCRKRYHYRMKTGIGRIIPRECPICGKQFEATNKHHRYCSARCRVYSGYHRNR